MPPDRQPLREALSTPERKHVYVRRLFSVIAQRYDLITVLLSYGQDRRWKSRLVDMAEAGPGTNALDVACGTGDIAFELARRGARVTGLDITHGMLRLAGAKAGGLRTSFVAGDMMALPFGDAQFDLVTTGYGIRNVPGIAPALTEIARVLRPGGTLLSLDFNRPANALVRGIYLGYLTIVGSLLGLVLHRDPDTYRYIPESIRRYPGAAAVADLIRTAGFSRCEWHPVLGGLMALHRARK
jgi:demethylmenaquinone methyltransferase/2-methoxy-6-polyprenyl-1,4-benzoquinol methylase